MDVDLTLDEIIKRKRISENSHGRLNDKKLTHSNYNRATSNKLAHKPVFKATAKAKHAMAAGQQPLQAQQLRRFDARNKIIQKTRAKISDARDILNKNMRLSGIDARQLLFERKKERIPAADALLGSQMVKIMAIPSSQLPRSGGAELGPVHKGRFGERMITMTNRPGGLIQTLWNSKDGIPAHAKAGEAASFKPTQRDPYLPRRNEAFAPRGYVDHDNMQDLEDEEIDRTIHFGNFNNQSLPCPHSNNSTLFKFGCYSEDNDVEMKSKSNVSEPFGMYKTAHNRIERPRLPLQLEATEKLLEHRQRHMVASSNLPDPLRARLFGVEPDRRISHGIYANENGSSSGKLIGSSCLARSAPSLIKANHKAGYRLLVSNLHANVTTADIRELFNDIGPMYDAHVVRPGTAEVIYKNLEHAEIAVETYHQREFDGQPMHCVLVNPHSSNRAAMSNTNRTVTTNSSGVEVDIDALHSVLFRDR